MSTNGGNAEQTVMMIEAYLLDKLALLDIELAYVAIVDRDVELLSEPGVCCLPGRDVAVLPYGIECGMRCALRRTELSIS